MTTKKTDDADPVEALTKRVAALEAEVKKLRAEKAMLRGE